MLSAYFYKQTLYWTGIGFKRIVLVEIIFFEHVFINDVYLYIAP